MLTEVLTPTMQNDKARMRSEDFIWVSKQIASCVNDWQLQTAYKIIELFAAKHGRDRVANELDILETAYVQKQSILNL